MKTLRDMWTVTAVMLTHGLLALTGLLGVVLVAGWVVAVLRHRPTRDAYLALLRERFGGLKVYGLYWKGAEDDRDA